MRPAAQLCTPALSVMLAISSLACDDKQSTVPAPQVASDEPEPEPQAEPGPKPQAEPEPEPEPEPPPPPPGPSCDQRESKQTCVDYGAHRGAAAPRCAEGLELARDGCAREAVVARCTLPATGVVLYSYEGRSPEQAQTECETVDGQLEEGAEPALAGPG